MRRVTPIQVIIIRHHDDPLTEEYAAVMKQVFTGAPQEDARESLYFTEALGMGVPLLDPQIVDSRAYRRALLGGAKVSIAVEIRSRQHREWPLAVKELLKERRVVPIPIDIPPKVADGTIQLSVTEVGAIEPSFAPVAAALATLEQCRLQLIHKVYGRHHSDKPSKLFISHAKADGMAMAHAIASLLNRLQSMPQTRSLFNYFYDAESIQPGDQWRNILRLNAKSCLFMALRTEEYDSRYWCRQEFLWAERKHMPMVVVDLRRNMYCPASPLPLDSVGSAKIIDGNLIRVLFHAIKYHIDYLQLQYRVNPKSGEVVIPRYPSAVSIEGAMETISRVKGDRKIIYAGATLPKSRVTAINAQLESSGVTVMSETEWEMAHA